MKGEPPYKVWNTAVEMTGVGEKASAADGAAELKRLRAELGADFDAAFRLRMVTARARTLAQLLEEWVYERARLGV